MALSSSDEVQTAILNVTASAGTTEQQQLDAQEDRRIVGFGFSGQSASVGEDTSVLAKLFTGVDPDPPLDDAEDLGGKFYAQFEFVQDSTNGWARESTWEPDIAPENAGWDWNEDVTLTLEVDENSGSGDGGVMCMVYYKEV